MVVNTFNLSTQKQRQEELSEANLVHTEFQVSQDYIVTIPKQKLNRKIRR